LGGADFSLGKTLKIHAGALPLTTAR
jgi:hypothetical protein